MGGTVPVPSGRGLLLAGRRSPPAIDSVAGAVRGTRSGSFLVAGGRLSAETPAERERRLVDAARERASRSSSARTAGHTPSAAETRDEAPLPRFTGYRVLREADRGGQGVVFEALQESTGRLVAIKLLRGGALAGGQSRARMQREVQILAQLDDEGVCPVIDFLSEASHDFVVMPFIEGENLAKRLARAAELRAGGAPAELAWRAIAGEAPARGDGASERSALALAVRQIEEVARSIHAVHERGIVHRDLKPGNVMLRPGRRPVVLDFGLAIDLSDDEAARFTPSGEPVGTPAYMAPEQLQGNGARVDGRADVYALGALLYELAAFRRPFAGSSLAAMCSDIVAGRFAPPRAHERSVPADLEAVCSKAMALDPAARYASALELAQDLARFRAGEPTLARPLPAWRRVLRAAGRHKALAAVGFLIAALLVLSVRELRRPARLDASLHAAWSAAAAGRALEGAHERRLGEWIVDERARALLTARPRSLAELDALIEEHARAYAAAESERPRIVPLAPRGAVLDAAPDFRFQAAFPAGIEGDLAVYEVRVFDAEREIALLPVSQVAGGSSLLSAALGPGERLAPGVEYGWSIELRGRAPRPLARTARALFRVVDPKLAADRLRALPEAASPDSSALARAACFLALDLAGEAREALRDRVGAPNSEESRHAALLRALAAAMVGDEAQLAAQRAAYMSAVEALDSGERSEP